MQDLMRQANLQVLDLATAWQNGTVNQKQELAKGLFPDGLAFSDEKKFFGQHRDKGHAAQVVQDFMAGKTDDLKLS